MNASSKSVARRVAAGIVIGVAPLLCPAAPLAGDTASQEGGPVSKNVFRRSGADRISVSGTVLSPLSVVRPGTADGPGGAGYIPAFGASALRIEQDDSSFDRMELLPLEEFLASLAPAATRNDSHAMLPAAMAAPEPPVLPEFTLPVDRATLPGGGGRASQASLPATGDAQAATTQQASAVVSAGQAATQPPGQVPAATGNLPTVSPEDILRYFEIRDRAQGGAAIGIPFTFPYQAQQPLIMESDATYTQVPGPANAP